MVRLEIRSNDILIEGYVNVPGKKSRVIPSIRGKFTESINEGVFQDAINNADEVKLLFNHNENRKLGSTKSNLTLKEDQIGLHASATIQDDEIRKLALDNKLTGWSFGFVVTKDKWSDGDEGIQHRSIEAMNLLEVSVLSVTPAYYATKVESRDSKSEIIERRAMDDVSIEVKDVDPKDDDKSNEEKRLLLCEKHRINTLIRIAKAKMKGI